LCNKETDNRFLKILISLFVNRLEYDNVTRKTHNSPGVDIKIPGFGGTDTVEFLDHSEISLSK
jgi:hypothetical protein